MPSLIVQPGGHIVRGSAEYSIVDDKLSAHLDLTVSIGFFTKNVSLARSFQGKPGQFEKAAFLAAGSVQDFPGGLSVKVLDVKDGQSHVSFTGPDVAGVATVDVSGYSHDGAALIRLDGQVTYLGITQNFTVLPT